MDSKSTVHHNKLMQLENLMLMYGVYNAEMLEKIINTLHHIHNTTSSHDRLFARQQNSLTLRSVYVNSLGLHSFHKYITLFKNSTR